MRHRPAAALLCLLALAACGDPKDVAGWAKRAASRNRLDEKLEALDRARTAPGDRKAAVPALEKILGQAPRARAAAAVLLGEIGDPAAGEPLVAAIDPGTIDREVMDANRQIATALGALRDRAAVPVLVKLTASTDAYTQVAAIDALGRIGDPAAVDPLVTIAADDRVQPFIAKKALLALGRIGDPRAVPTVVKMLFTERQGVSFYPEAAFAAYQLGAPAAPPLVAVLEGRDPALEAWARTSGVAAGALYAKAAQVLGDLGDHAAVAPLLAKLAYRDARPELEAIVRVYAAESLGRLRAREAVKPIGDLVVREKDPDVRDRFCDALVRIGDPAALPALRAAAAGAGGFDLREGPLAAMSRLGGEAERAAIDAGRARDCGASCPDRVRRAYDAMAARLDAAKACGSDLACWTGKLADASAAVRDRAALEVGRAGTPRQAAALADAIARPVSDDGDVAARYHALLALSWLSRTAPLGADAAPIAAKLEGVVAADKGRTLTAGADEDALRLATRLAREAR